MKLEKYLWPILFTFLVLLVLQFIPVLINPELLTFNDRFILGYFVGANNWAMIVLVAFSYFPILMLDRSNDKIVRFSSTILLASILSNLLDRVFRGGATDYITIGHWPTFNVADVLIIVSIVLLAINFLSSNKKPRAN